MTQMPSNPHTLIKFIARLRGEASTDAFGISSNFTSCNAREMKNKASCSLLSTPLNCCEKRKLVIKMSQSGLKVKAKDRSLSSSAMSTLASKSNSHNHCKEKGRHDEGRLNDMMKYTIYTSVEPSETIVLSSKPILGKNITEAFKTRNDLMQFTSSIMKETSLYDFDTVYNETNTLEQVYKENIKESIGNIFNGRNSCCVFFGPINSGKSYTLRGGVDYSNSNSGLLTKGINDILNLIDLSHQSTFPKHSKTIGQPNHFYVLKASVFQVYLDHIHDLLSKDVKEVRIEKYWKEDNVLLSNLIGLTRRDIRNMKEYDGMIKDAVQQRKFLGQVLKVNELKRKSHLVIRISLEKIERTVDGMIVKYDENSIEEHGVIDFVELASSDYGLMNTVKPQNKKLYEHMSKTINAFAHNLISISNDISPSKETKLTLALKKTLRGNSRIMFFCCVIPWEFPLEQSYKAIQFTHWIRNQIVNLKENQDYQLEVYNTITDHNDDVMNVTRKHKKTNSMCMSNSNAYCNKINSLMQSKPYQHINNNDPKSFSSSMPSSRQIRHSRHSSCNSNTGYSTINHHQNNSNKNTNDGYNSFQKQHDRHSSINDNSLTSTPHEQAVRRYQSFDSHSPMTVIPHSNINDVSPNEKIECLEGILKQLEQKNNMINEKLENIRMDKPKIEDCHSSSSLVSMVNIPLNKYISSPSLALSIQNEIEMDKLRTNQATLQSDNIIFKEEINKLTGLNQHLESELQRQRVRNVELASDNERNQQEKEGILNDLRKANDTISALKTQEQSMVDAKNKAIEYENRMKEAESELRKVKDDRTQYEIEHRLLKDKYAELQRTYEVTNADLIGSRERYQMEIEKIDQRIEAMTREIDSLHRENSTLRINNERLRIDINYLEKQRDNFKDKYHEYHQKNNLLKIKMVEIENDFHNLLLDKTKEEDDLIKEKEIHTKTKRAITDLKTKIVTELHERISSFRSERLKKNDPSIS